MFPDFETPDRALNAVLPEGIYPASIAQIRERFVDGFDRSCQRKPLFERYEAWRYVVHKLLDVEHEYLDGSFVTDRLNPRDIDVSIWVDADKFLALPKEGRAGVLKMFRLDGLNMFGIDAILVTECDEGHPLYAQFIEDRDWTLSAWSTGRIRGKQPHVEGVPKGYLEVVS